MANATRTTSWCLLAAQHAQVTPQARQARGAPGPIAGRTCRAPHVKTTSTCFRRRSGAACGVQSCRFCTSVRCAVRATPVVHFNGHPARRAHFFSFAASLLRAF